MRSLRHLHAASLLLLLGGAVAPTWARDAPPAGLLAASVGEHVVLAEPAGSWSASFECGPVGWLYPAPGGRLFAPDLVNGRTTVFDVRLRRPVERLDGVTMPHFGLESDRYVVVTESVMVVAYPHRALISAVDAGIRHPWQVIVARDGTSVFVLERAPGSVGRAALVAVDLIGRRVVYREQLSGDVVHMAHSPDLGLMALADRGGRVRLIDPGSRKAVAVLELPGQPQDVAFAGSGELLAVALSTANDQGGLWLASVKAGRKGLKWSKDHMVPLAARPVRLAVGPDGSQAAVALTSARIEVFELDHRQPLGAVALPTVARDLVWCDPLRDGPLLPEWSD